MPAGKSPREWIECTVLTLVLLLVAPSGGKEKSMSVYGGGGMSFYEKSIRCVIDTRNDAHDRFPLHAGFNYELLKSFADQHNCSVSVRIARGNENYVDSLILGTVDILVMDADTTQIGPIIKSRDVDRRFAWYMKEDSDEEIKDINMWINSFTGTKRYKDLRSRFNAAYNPYSRVRRGVVAHRISPYDDLIRQYARTLGWDWRLLTAAIYQESKFAINTVSKRGAMGLMQIMPATGLHYGVTDLIDPEQNLIAGTRFLADIQRGFPAGEFSPEERVNFTLAAYNAGEGRISDCRIIARSKGLDDTRWENIVQVIPEMRQYTIESADSTVIRTGSFIGTETINHVRQIMDLYGMFCEICPDR